MMTATQPRAPGRAVTLNPFELGASARESRETASPHDLGCVDWYLYPDPVVTRSRATDGARSAPRGGGTAPSRRT